MAGQLTISTLSDGTNSTSSTNCIRGSAKAWVNFNSSSGSSAVIRSSYNISSVTYVSTGVFTLNFTNALSNANYAINGMAMLAGQTGTAVSGVVSEFASVGNAFDTRTTSAVKLVVTDNNSDNYFNAFSCSVAVFD